MRLAPFEAGLVPAIMSDLNISCSLSSEPETASRSKRLRNLDVEAGRPHEGRLRKDR